MTEEEERRLLDPTLKRVPYERLDQARHALLKTQSANARAGIPNVTWQERGPSNAGGRTRALLFDPTDPTHKKVWAGSIAGGLWYTNDITDATANWTPVSDAWENTVVTAIAADPSNPQVMYVGTGDAYNYVTGGGIWKTTNGGTSWTRLTNTVPTNNAPSITYGFGYVQRIIVNNSGQIFVATRLGVVRSGDGGANWQYALAPGQSIGVSGSTGGYYNDLVTDLELAADGILYAAFNPSRVFKSNDAAGTSWTEITPTNAGGERTELALVPSTNGTNQVLYGVARAYNNASPGKDIKWFKKSTNGGTSWTDILIPTYAYSGSHFTSGSGFYGLSLVTHPTDANTIYAGGSDWFRSTDGGVSWSTELTTTYQYQQGVLFQPGSGTAAALFNDNGVYWSIDWGDNTQTKPTLTNRNTGYRAGETSSISMRSSPGSTYLLAGVRPSGYFQMTSSNVSAGSLLWNVTSPGITFIDADEPSIQIIQSYGAIYQYTTTGSTQLATVNSYYPSAMTADYDSQANTLYIADMVNNQAFVRKITGIGSTPQSTTLTLTGLTDLANYMKLSSDRTKLYVGFYSGQVYQVTNLAQSNPTITRIDNGALPQYGSVSCIDVGTDDELLITFSNFGTQSVWYTNNGGTTWVGKDQTNFGLPDVPVRSALFNPQNRKQVLLGTDAGIWSTDDITATNPGWAYTSAGMGPFRINQLRYRASDGRITAATNGRGAWITDAFAIPYTLPGITITSISNATLCAGSTFTVSFSTSGSGFGVNNTFEVWLSDGNGNFTSQIKLGSGTTSPLSATLPTSYSALPYGTNYQLKIIATNPDVESSPSGALIIGNLGSASISDRRAELGQNWSTGTVCTGSQAILKAYSYKTNNSAASPDSYQWLINGGSAISGATSATYSAKDAGRYTVVVKQGGCTVTSSDYVLYTSATPDVSLASPSNGEPLCDDRPTTIYTNYIGETASYQWVRDGSDITGATSFSYGTNQTGNYSIRVSDGSCSLTSSPTYYEFGRSLYVTIASYSLYQQTNADTVLCGSSGGTLMAFFSSSNNSTFQWYRDGKPIAGATFSTYSPTQPGLYSILLKRGTCQTFSNGIAVRSSNFIASIAALTPVKNACPGETQALSAVPSFNATFQWQKDGVDIPSATTNNLTASVTGNYTVRVTRGSCTAISEPLSLTFSNDIKPTLSAYESCSGTNLNVTGTFKLTGYQYQWYRNGNPISGSTNSFLYTSQADVYSVRITNGSCTGLSKEVYANGNSGQLLKPGIAVLPKTRHQCQYNSALLSAIGAIGSLQWRRNGVAIPSATRIAYYATQSGFYSVVSTSGNCQAESDPIELKIGEATTATLSGNSFINSGQSASLPVTFTGPSPWSFTLTNGQSVTATYQNPAFISVSPTSNTTYQLASVANGCGLGTTAGQATVSVGMGSADVSLSLAVDKRTPNVGEVVTYTLMAANAGPNDAVGVQLNSILPTGLTFIGSSSPGVNVANGVVSANLGTIPANALNAISFQATPTQLGVFATSAQITATQTPDPDSQPNSGTGDGQDDEATVDVRTPSEGTLVTSANPNQVPLPMVSSNQPVPSLNSADLSLTMQVNKLTPAASQNEVVTTTLTVSNRGGSSASSVVVQVVLPNGTFSAQSPAGWLPVDGQPRTYKRFINSLAAGQSATVSLQWQPAANGTLRAQILDMVESDPDSTPGNGYTQGEDDEAAVSIRVR